MCCSNRSPRHKRNELSPDYSRMIIVDMLPEQMERKIRDYEKKHGMPKGEGQSQVREVMIDEVEREVYFMQ